LQLLAGLLEPQKTKLPHRGQAPCGMKQPVQVSGTSPERERQVLQGHSATRWVRQSGAGRSQPTDRRS
jgi:hypothetical protein